ncbi:hypothetical protein RINTHM_12880 [Richelia intracellularis HM01]|nr:hypothetical protein RINTHM_12880 [Richelia intracellularis HM01]
MGYKKIELDRSSPFGKTTFTKMKNYDVVKVFLHNGFACFRRLLKL